MQIFANHEDQRSWIIEEILTSLIKLNDTKQKAGQFRLVRFFLCLCTVHARFFSPTLCIFIRLRDGRSIRTVSALLLQLVQTSAHDVRIEARKIDKARQNKFALRRQESFSESQPGPPEPFLDENDQGVCVDFFPHIFPDSDFLIFFCCSQEIRLYGTGLDSAVKAAKTMIIFLTQRWVLPVCMKLVCVLNSP